MVRESVRLPLDPDIVDFPYACNEVLLSCDECSKAFKQEESCRVARWHFSGSLKYSYSQILPC